MPFIWPVVPSFFGMLFLFSGQFYLFLASCTFFPWPGVPFIWPVVSFLWPGVLEAALEKQKGELTLVEADYKEASGFR